MSSAVLPLLPSDPKILFSAARTQLGWSSFSLSLALFLSCVEERDECAFVEDKEGPIRVVLAAKNAFCRK